MLYTIYKITNNINFKTYIGKHQTKNLDDGYLGSGKLIKRAIKKYGVDKFTKEILFIFDNEEDMNCKEKELVVIGEDSYNICEGGQGGFSYINRNRLQIYENHKDQSKTNLKKGSLKLRSLLHSKGEWKEEFKKKISIGMLKHFKKHPGHFKNCKHTEETKNKLRVPKGIGKQNSQFGTCWITNGEFNKKININDLDIWLVLGYIKGRKM